MEAETAKAEPKDTSREEEERQHVLSCQQCKLPIVLPEDVITERAEVLLSNVYNYELQLCITPDKDIACYSSTNPHGNRFDVIRTRPNEYIKLTGTPSPECCWFTGTAYVMAHCVHCSHMLGWGYVPLEKLKEIEERETWGNRKQPRQKETEREDKKEEGEEEEEEEEDMDEESEENGKTKLEDVAFFGLIVTKLTPQYLTISAIEESREQAFEKLTFNPTLVFSDVVRLMRELSNATRRSAPRPETSTAVPASTALQGEADALLSAEVTNIEGLDITQDMELEMEIEVDIPIPDDGSLEMDIDLHVEDE
eukprot:TRINITY_DN2118_c1_g1_i4.p1 TRINITY_DN2118_c1_g1~~TRINITY_DN2118_c1_g1_i4.p1  ORF type:complete len:323 (+),score=90.73 TRINITY_DN2118_c1_g1_i4:40-969(+)